MKRYLTHAETRKAIVTNLKAKFPLAKFSITKDGTTGSIRVRWQDGPSREAVSDVVGFVHNSGFDGMIDMGYFHSHYYNPERGTLRYAGTDGTGMSGGSVSAVSHEIEPGEVPVCVSNPYMNVERSYTAAFLRDVVAPYMMTRYGRELDRDFVIRVQEWDGSAYMEPVVAFHDNPPRHRDISDELRLACLQASA